MQNSAVLSLILYGSVFFLLMSTISLAILLGIYVGKYETALGDIPGPVIPLPGYDFAINTTYDGGKISHLPITVTLRWNDAAKAINMKYIAPFYNNPAPNHTTGAVPELWNYEVVEIFLANSQQQYLETELGPHNQWLCYLLDGERQSFNHGEMLQLSVWNRFPANTWVGEVDIPLAYLPANVSSLNIYHIYDAGSTRIYESLHPAPPGKGPDFHQLQYFLPIDWRRLIPSKLFSPTRPYLDPRYPDVWKGHYTQ